MSQNKLGAFCFLLILTFIFSCKKEVHENLIETGSMIRTFPMAGTQNCNFIKATSDNGIQMIGTTNGFSCLFLKANGSGKLLSSRVISQDSMVNNWIIDARDGNILMNNVYGVFWKTDLEGNQIFRNNFTGIPTTTYRYGFPVEADNGKYYISACRGGSTGSIVDSYVYVFAPDGQPIIKYIFPDSLFLAGKVFILNMYRYEDPQTYYFYGLLCKEIPFAWEYNARIFTAKLQFSGANLISRQINIIDPANQNENNGGFSKAITTPDKSMFFVVNRSDINAYNYCHLVKISASQQVLWEKDLKLSGFNTNLGQVELCSNGNYLVFGSFTEVSDKTLIQPFAALVSPNGDIIWKKKFSVSYGGNFTCARQLPDGDFIFGGTTNSFGKSFNGDDMFFIKTDSEGNLK